MGKINKLDGTSVFELNYRTVPLEYKVQETGNYSNLVVKYVDEQKETIDKFDNQGTTLG